MAAPDILFGKMTRWAGRVWMLVLTAARSGLGMRRVDASGPLAPLADTLEQQRQGSLDAIARQVAGLRDGPSGDLCRNVVAELEGDRQSTLNVLEQHFPALQGVAADAPAVHRERVICCTEQDRSRTRSTR
jgi:hypothetical protein